MCFTRQSIQRQKTTLQLHPVYVDGCSARQAYQQKRWCNLKEGEGQRCGVRWGSKRSPTFSHEICLYYTEMMGSAKFFRQRRGKLKNATLRVDVWCGRRAGPRPNNSGGGTHRRTGLNSLWCDFKKKQMQQIGFLNSSSSRLSCFSDFWSFGVRCPKSSESTVTEMWLNLLVVKHHETKFIVVIHIFLIHTNISLLWENRLQYFEWPLEADCCGIPWAKMVNFTEEMDIVKAWFRKVFFFKLISLLIVI